MELISNRGRRANRMPERLQDIQTSMYWAAEGEDTNWDTINEKRKRCAAAQPQPSLLRIALQTCTSLQLVTLLAGLGLWSYGRSRRTRARCGPAMLHHLHLRSRPSHRLCLWRS